jgi:uncharacterized protein
MPSSDAATAYLTLTSLRLSRPYRPGVRLVGLAGGLVALAFAAVAAAAAAWEAGTDGLAPIPPLAAHVTDLTATLAPAERQALEAKLTDWEARTTNQFAVLVVPSTQPEPIEAYSIRVADAWKIGRKGHDNGVLFVVAKDDRKMRLEVGYGFEGVLTDATSRRIIAETVAPQFREGRFAAGIAAGVDRVIAVVSEGKPLPPAKAGNVAQSKGGGFSLETLLLLLFVVVPVVGSVLRSLLGRLLGSTVGAGIVGAAAWFVAGSVAIGVIAGIVGFIVMIFLGSGAALAGRRGGVFLPGGFGGGGGGFGGGGGSWGGGGGGFGGGGASGGW